MKKLIRFNCDVLVEVPDDKMTEECLKDACQVLYEMNWDEYFRHIAVEYVRAEYNEHIDGIGDKGEHYDAEVTDTWTYVLDHID